MQDVLPWDCIFAKFSRLGGEEFCTCQTNSPGGGGGMFALGID